jgi:predicted ATP-grasp superfamily ATP-dependent carboligase
MADKPHLVICITCVGGRLIYDIISALRDADDYTVTVVGVDADPDAAGRLLCDKFFVLPMADSDPDGWVKAILELQSKTGVTGLICLSDQEARLAAQQADKFASAGIRTSVSSWETVNAMTDKLLLLQMLVNGGLKVGPFKTVDSTADAYAAVTELGYPGTRIVLKPRWGRGSRGVLVCDAARKNFELFLPDRFCGAGTFDQVMAELERQKMDLDGWVAVPYWDGPVFDVECIVDKGKVVLSAARRRQLRNPFSPTSTGHIVDLDPRVLEYAKDMCRILNVKGAADFDIVLRPDGTPAPFDASARFSGSIGGSYTAGGNFLAQLVRVMFGMPLASYLIRDKTPLRSFITMAVIPDANSEELL